MFADIAEANGYTDDDGCITLEIYEDNNNVAVGTDALINGGLTLLFVVPVNLP